MTQLILFDGIMDFLIKRRHEKGDLGHIAGKCNVREEK